MKKITAIILTVTTVFVLASLGASARVLTPGEQGIFDKLREGVQAADGRFYLPEETIVQGENYQKANSLVLTQAEVDEIMKQIDIANQAVIDAGTGNAYKWTKKTRNEVLTAIDNAAQQIIVNKGTDSEHTLRARGHLIKGISTIEVYDPALPKGNDTLVREEHLIKKTGADYTAFIIAGICSVAVLSACAVVSKKAKLF